MESTLTAFDGAFLRLPTTGELDHQGDRGQGQRHRRRPAAALCAPADPLQVQLRGRAGAARPRRVRRLDDSARQHRRARQGGARRRAGGHRHRQRERGGPSRQLPRRREVREPHARGLPRPDAADRPQDHAGDRRRVPGRGGRRPARPAGADPASPGTLVNREADSAPLLGPVLHRLRHRQGRALAGRRRRHRLRPAHHRAVRRLRRLAQDRPGVGGHRQRLPDRFAARPLADLGQRVVRRARARRRPRQPAAQRADGVRQHAGAVAARRRHLRLGVVRPDRPDQGDADRALRRRGGAGPGGGGDADRHAGLGRARQRHGPARPVLLDDRRVGAGADPDRPGHRQRLERHRAAQHHPRGPERQLLGHLVGLHRGAGHGHLHDLRDHRRRHADHCRRRVHPPGPGLELPGAHRVFRDRSTWWPGQRYPIKIRNFQGGGQTEAHVSWQIPGGVKELLPVDRMYPY